MRTFTQKLIGERGQLVYYVTGDIPGFAELGTKKWFYISIHPNKQRAFLAAMESDSIEDLSVFGEILANGLGTPSAAIIAELKERYGFDIIAS